MKNRTDIIGVSGLDRLRQMIKTYYGALELITAALISFMMSNSYIFDGLSPFGVAFFAASRGKISTAAALGGVVGYFLSLNSFVNMKYIAAIVIIATLKWAFRIANLHMPDAVVPSLFSIAGLGITTISLLSISGADRYQIIVAASEVLLAGGAAYFFARAFKVVERGDRFNNLQRSDIYSLTITFCILIVSLSAFPILGLSVGRICAALAVLIMARRGGESAGAVCGVIAGSAISITGGGSVFLSAYALGGIITGMFSVFGRFGCAISFAVVNGFAVLISGYAMTGLYEAFVASVIFMIIPSNMFEGTVRVKREAVISNGDLRALVCSRLSMISEALNDICGSIRRVSQKLNEIQTGDISAVFSRAADKVCRNCKERSFCWQEGYNDTMNAFNDITAALKKNGKISKASMPDYFIDRCRKLDMMVPVINNEYGEFIACETRKRKACEMRMVVSEQFEGMSALLNSFSEELKYIGAEDKAMVKKTADYFSGIGLNPLSVNCFRDASGRLCVEVHVSLGKLPRLSFDDAAQELSAICRTVFSRPEIVQSAKYAALIYNEAPAYRIRYGEAQISGTPKVCGDSCKCFSDRAGTIHMIISDGMGSGGGAALDSTMTTTLLSRLIESGVDMEAAMKMVNSALVLKSSNESFATIDISSIDLYTGSTTFRKSGAAPSFVLKSGRAGYVESMSLPAGILSGVEFESASITLGAGDMIVMVSDGVTATGLDWVKAELQNHRGSDPQALCERIAKSAVDRRGGEHKDDISVMAAFIDANENSF